MQGPGRKSYIKRKAVCLYLRQDWLDKLQERASRRLSKIIEEALMFYSKYKLVVDDMEEYKRKVGLVECVSCGSRFSPVLRKCPECGGVTVRFVDESMLNEAEKRILMPTATNTEAEWVKEKVRQSGLLLQENETASE